MQNFIDSAPMQISFVSEISAKEALFPLLRERRNPIPMNISSSPSLLKKHFLAPLVAIIALLGIFSLQAHASNSVWAGVATTGTEWNVAGNWSTSAIPNSTSVIAEFPTIGSLSPTIDVNAPVSVGELLFDVGGYTISSGNGTGTISLNAATAISVSAGTDTINTGLILPNSGGTITFSVATGANLLTVGGVISGGGGGGTLSLAQTANSAATTAPMITLANTNTFTDTVQLPSGVVQINSSSALGNSSNAVNFTSTNPNSLAGLLVNFSGADTYAFTASSVYEIGVTSGNTVLLPNLTGAGSSVFTLFNSGTLKQSANSQFGSSMDISAGTLDLNGFNDSNSALKGPGGTIQNSSATLSTLTITGLATGVTQLTTAITGNIAVNYDASATLTLAGGGAFTGGLTVTLGTLQNGGNVGAFGSGDVTIVTNAAIDLAKSTQSTAATSNIGLLSGGGTVKNSTTTAAAIQTLILNPASSSDSQTFSGAITQTTGTIALTLDAGTQTLNGATALTYTGATTVNGGTLKLDFANMGTPTNLLSTSTPLVLGGGKLAILGQNTSSNTSQTFNGWTVGGASASAISVTSGGGAGTPVLALGALIRNTDTGGTVDFTTLPSGTPSATNGVTMSSPTLVSNVLTSAGVAFATVGGGADWASASGNNIIGYSTNGGTGVYATGNTSYVSGSNVNVTNGDAPSTTSTVNTLRFSTASTGLTLTGVNTIATGGILVTSAGTSDTITGGTIEAGNSGKELVIINNGSLTIGSAIGVSAASYYLTISGAGTTILTGANVNKGGMFIDAGATLQIGNGGSTGSIGNAGNVTNNGNLVFNSTATYSQGTSGDVISGIGALTVDNGTFGAGAANTYTGVTSINGGILYANRAETVGVSGPMGKSAASNPGSIVFGGGILQYSSNTNNDYSGRFSIAANQPISIDTNGRPVTFATALTSNGGSLTLQDTNATPGSLTLTAANTFTGATTINTGGKLDLQNQLALQNSTFTGGAGSLVFDSSVATNAFTFGGLSGASNLALQNNAGSPAAVALTVGNNNGSTTYSGALSAAGSLTKIGTGALTLSGANTYTGATTITAGTLKLGVAGALGNGTNNTSGVTVGATGAALDLAGFTPTAIVSLNLNGTGVSSNGALTDSGAAATYGGAVTLQTASSIGGSGNITLSNSVSGAFGLTYAGSGTLMLSGPSNASTTTTIIPGGTVQIGAAGTSGALGSGAVTDNGTLTFNRTDTYGGAVSNAINGSGGVNLTAGTLSLSGNDGYNGATNVNGGTLIVSGQLSGVSQATTVAAGATLGGGGTIAGTLSVTGTVAPGTGLSAAGTTLTIGNNVNFNNGSQLVINLNDSTTTTDLLAITGALSLGSGDTLTINLMNGDLASGHPYIIATFTGGETGTFANVNYMGGANADNYTVEYNTNNIELIASVPEPGTWAMFLAGLGVLGMWQRSRRLRM